MNRCIRAHLSLGLFATLVAGSAEVRASEPRVRRNLEIEFEAIEGATGYEVRVTRKDGEKQPLTFRLKNPRWSADIKPGPYVMQLRAFDDRGVPGEWSPPSDIIVKLPTPTPLAPLGTLTASAGDREEIELSWQPIGQAKGYRLDIHAANGTFHQTLEAKTNHLRTTLDVAAAYEWSVVAIDADQRDGDAPARANAFLLRGPALEKPRPAPPLSRFVNQLSWPAVDHAELYQTELKVWDKPTKSWLPVPGPATTTTGSYDLDIARPSGRYKFAVTAVAANRESSRRAELTFFAEGGFTDPSRLRDARLRDSLEKPSAYYAIATLLPTAWTYESAYAETNSRVGYDAIGITARAGLGYQKRGSPWGGFAVADLGRTPVANQTFTSSSGEAHATYRLSFGRRGVARLGAGVYVKQIPLIIGSPVYGFSTLGRVSTMGPHAGASYEIPLSERWGARADARFYYGLTGSTGGGALSAATAYQGELLGTYRLGRAWILTGGLGQRRDQVTWTAQPGAQSFARPGQSNSITAAGTYLHLGVEFGF